MAVGWITTAFGHVLCISMGIGYRLEAVFEARSATSPIERPEPGGIDKGHGISSDNTINSVLKRLFSANEWLWIWRLAHD